MSMVGREYRSFGGSPSLPDKHGTKAAEKSFGEFPADPLAYYRLFRDKWPEFIRRNFRNSTDAAAFFGVDDRTVRGWIEGSTAPRGQVVAYAAAKMPKESASLIKGNAA